MSDETGKSIVEAVYGFAETLAYCGVVPAPHPMRIGLSQRAYDAARGHLMQKAFAMSHSRTGTIVMWHGSQEIILGVSSE